MRQPECGGESQIAVSVVSGTYNRLPLLKRMVDSARISARDLALEIVLVDGGSDDGTLDWCKAQSDVTLVQHGELLGAIRAYNDGCAAAQGRYVVIGNDDIAFNGETIHLAYKYMEEHPEAGQVAFGHRYQKRGAPEKATIQGAFGYLYGQCCMTPRWLGDLAGWWGDEGMRTYGGDTRFGLRLWEMGWPVVSLPWCSVTDYEHEDGLRTINSDTPWKVARMHGQAHPDTVFFNKAWSERLPQRREWIPTPVKRLVEKARRGNLRSLRFKSGMYVGAPTRTALIDALGKYGPKMQVNQTDKVNELGRAQFQNYVVHIFEEFEPDLVLFQAQRENNVTPDTVRSVKKVHPLAFLINWDGDTHPLMTPFHYEIARAVHLQLVVSPTVFPLYAAEGIGVGYWPIGIEQEYIDQERAAVEDLLDDVVFLGALYGEGVFPEAEFRRDAVVAMANSDLSFELRGPGWPKVGLKAVSTAEKHAASAQLYATAKMALSISQSADLWGYTSDRLYNICATGCPALVQRFTGMEQHGYVDGETCIAFATIGEMLDKARYYADAEHDEEREQIGAAGRALTLERHTWDARVEGLLAMLGDV